MSKKKNPHAVAMAKKRAKLLSPERRAEIAALGGAAKAKNAAARKLPLAQADGSV